MNYLVTFSDKKYKYNQVLNKESAKHFCSFNKIFDFTAKDIDKKFCEANKRILSYARGSGYWLWKPYIILKALNRASEDDIIFYCDSGSVFIDSVQPLLDLTAQFQQDIIPFGLELLEKEYTKRDAFVLMNCDEAKFTNTYQRLASFIVFRNSKTSRDFVNEWLQYCRDERILTDSDNTQGKNNYAEFLHHRHDQSVFSLLTKKYDLPVFRDPSQWGNSQTENYSNSNYGQILNHTRHIEEQRRLYKLLNRLILKLTNK
jgi:hypothetical protein